jgi:hypothetical protein
MIVVVVCTFLLLETGSWGCRICRGLSLPGKLVLQPFESTVGRDEQFEGDVRDLSSSRCWPGVGAMEKRSSSQLSLNLRIDIKSTSELSQGLLLMSSPLYRCKGDSGSKVQTSMMSGTVWADGPDSRIFITDQLLVIIGIEWTWEEKQETESACKIIAVMVASRYLLM